MHRSGLHAARRRRRLNGRSSQATDVQRIGRRWRAGVGWQCGQLVGVRLTGADAAAEQSGAATSGFFFARSCVPGASNARKQARVEQRIHVLFRRPSLAAWRARAVAMMLARIMLSRQPKLRERLGRRSQEPEKGPAQTGSRSC